MSGSMSFDNLSSLSHLKTSESFSDLNAELNNPNQQPPNPTDSSNPAASAQGSSSNFTQTNSTVRSTRSTFSGLGNMNGRNGEDGMNNKPFGLGKIHVTSFFNKDYHTNRNLV